MFPVIEVVLKPVTDTPLVELALPPDTLPVIAMVPVDECASPTLDAVLPPDTVPVIVTLAPPVTLTPMAFVPDPPPPVTLPTTVMAPVELLLIPFAPLPPLPAVTLLFTVTGPVPVMDTPYALFALPPVTAPLIVTVPAPDVLSPTLGPAVTVPVIATVPVVCEQRTHAPPVCPDEDRIFAVMFLAAVTLKKPDEVASSVPLPMLISWSIVTVKVDVRTVSPVVGGVPHTVLSDQFPVLVAVTIAISLFLVPFT